jgi:hypothetical protein
MGYRDYLRDACSEAVFGEDNDENNTMSSVSEAKWVYSTNGYCENCKVVVYNDKGTCPICHNPTKEKHHWCRH